jgi:hypothetical protein
VPALLAGDAGKVQAEQLCPEGGLTFFIVFCFDFDDEEDIASIQDAKKSGFLPIGLFPRLLGKAVSWSLTGGQKLPTKQNYPRRDQAKLAFGPHEYTMQELPEFNVVRVFVHGQNPTVVVERLEELVETSIAESIPNLHYFVAVQRSDGTLANLAKLREAADKAGGCQEDVAEFKVWLPASGVLQAYHGMLSYRWDDKTLVAQVFDYLCRQSVGRDKRRVEVFLDDRRLRRGRQFQMEFMQALLASKVAVPFVSMKALARMFHLQADSPCDNVLLEWSVILELVAAKRLKVCLPIMIGEKEGVSPRLRKFDMKVADTLPEVVVGKVVDEIERFFAEAKLGEPTAELKTRTVKQIVKGLFKFLFFDAADAPQDALAAGIGGKVLGSIKEQLTGGQMIGMKSVNSGPVTTTLTPLLHLLATTTATAALQFNHSSLHHCRMT